MFPRQMLPGQMSMFYHNTLDDFIFVSKVNLPNLSLLKGVPKKTSLNVCHSFCLIAPSKNMLEGWDIIHLKGDTHSSVWSTETFLYNKREPRYK